MTYKINRQDSHKRDQSMSISQMEIARAVQRWVRMALHNSFDLGEVIWKTDDTVWEDISNRLGKTLRSEYSAIEENEYDPWLRSIEQKTLGIPQETVGLFVAKELIVHRPIDKKLSQFYDEVGSQIS